MRKPLYRRAMSLVLLAALGCPASPEDGRSHGGGRGADGGNYRAKPLPVPSKLDGTKDLRPILPARP
jgi:hypothetical protein